MRQPALVWLLAGSLGCAGGLVPIAAQEFVARNDVATVPLEQPTETPTTTSTTTPTTTPPVNDPPPLTAADYQRVLTAIDGRLLQVLWRLAATRTPTQVDAVRIQLVSTLRSQAVVLKSQKPPPTVVAAHAQLQSALRTAADQLAILGVDSHFCGGAPATIRRIHEVLTRGGIGLPRATAALRAHLLTAGKFLPRRPDLRPRRGTNGKIWRSGRRGSGRLEIANQGSDDYVISVVTGKPSSPQIMIYVRAHSKAKVSGVRGSVYHVYVKGGTDWDDTRRQFTRDCNFEKFDQPFTQLSYPYYSIWKITLDTPGGTATSSHVDPY